MFDNNRCQIVFNVSTDVDIASKLRYKDTGGLGLILCRCLPWRSVMVAIGERVHYLSLALDARRALNAIRSADQSGEESPELQDSIRAATESLEILSTHADLYAKHAPQHYNRYEEIQTLREVSSSIDAESLLRSMKTLLSGSGKTRDDLQVVRKFFRALESRALHHYNDPTSADAILT